MRLTLIVLAVSILSPMLANAACSLDERLNLSKSGYAKEEIETMCTGSADTLVSEPLPQGLDLLKQASMVGSGVKEAEKRRCKFSEEGVYFKKGFFSYDKLNMSATRKVDPEDKEMLLVVTLDLGFNKEFCLVMRVDKWKYERVEAERFNEDLNKYQAEQDAVVSELRALSVKEKK